MPTSIIAAAAIGGLVMSGVGMMKQQDALKQQKAQQTAAAGEMMAAQTDEIQNEQAVEGQKRKQMDLDYRRQQLQIVRNSQQARSLSLATATHQGVGGQAPSSALSGAFAGEQSSARLQTVAGNQNYQIGNDIFDLNKKISADRIQYANAQTQYNLAGSIGAANAGAGAGMMSLGGAMVSAAGTFGNVASSAGGMFKNGLSFGTGPGAWGSNGNLTV